MHVKTNSFVFFCLQMKACVKEYRLLVSVVHVSASIDTAKKKQKMLVKPDTTIISWLRLSIHVKKTILCSFVRRKKLMLNHVSLLI